MVTGELLSLLGFRLATVAAHWAERIGVCAPDSEGTASTRGESRTPRARPARAAASPLRLRPLTPPLCATRVPPPRAHSAASARAA